MARKNTYLWLVPDELDDSSPEAVRALGFAEMLEGPHATAVYRQLIRRWTTRVSHHPARLSYAEFHFLCTLLEYGSRLRNVFPKRATLAQELGIGLKLVERRITSLVKKGWLRRHRFAREDGAPSSSGCQFLVPPDVLGPGHAGWEGPKDFKHHGQNED